jgi:hypothetical protein
MGKALHVCRRRELMNKLHQSEIFEMNEIKTGKLPTIILMKSICFVHKAVSLGCDSHIRLQPQGGRVVKQMIGR